MADTRGTWHDETALDHLYTRSLDDDLERADRENRTRCLALLRAMAA